MQLHTLLLPLAASVLCTAVAQVSIPIANPGFEEDELFCGGCFYPATTGWSVGPNSGVQKASTSESPGGVPDGANFAYVGDANSTGSLTQVLNATVRANATYTLTMSVGQQLGIALTGYVAALMAGGVTLASNNSLKPAPGTFLEETIVYDSGPNPPQIGRPLLIFVKSFGNGQVDIDNVALTV